MEIDHFNYINSSNPRAWAIFPFFESSSVSFIDRLEFSGWSNIPLFQNCPQFIVIHTVKGFGIVNKAEIDISLELSHFFHDPADVGNLFFGT